MASSQIKDGGIEFGGENKLKRRGRPGKNVSNPNSRNSSRNNSPAKIVDTGNKESEEIWKCNVCSKFFGDPDDKVLECQRCRDHFCIKCLNKSVEEYNLMNNSDIMWFCVPCREKVERNIVVDREIEERCNDMMKMFDSRIRYLEEEVAKKCDEGQVRNIVSEMTKVSVASQENGDTNYGRKDGNEQSVTAVMSEINERKNRECNMIIYGIKESDSDDKETRRNYDREHVERVAETCDVSLEEDSITKILRLGKFNSEKKNRPLLVSFSHPGKKVEFFKGGSNLRDNARFKDVRLANDLTRTEREMEKNLYAKARDLTEKSSGEFRFRVRGPPWARKVVKVRISDQE